MTSPDVTILGAGVFGLSVGWACAARGAKVRVIDPAGPGAGASGGVVGALAPHVPEQWNPVKAFQFESLMMAEPWWRQVEATGGQSAGYARLGRLQPIADAAGLERAKARAQSAAELWQGRAEWRVVEARDSGVLIPRSPTGMFVFDTLSARLSPFAACQALAAAIRNRGGDVVDAAPVTGAVVHATGWRGLEQMTKAHSRLVGAGIKGQAALLDFDARRAPQVFADSLHFVPHADGTLAIGSTTEREFDEPDTTDTQLEAIIAQARQICPDIADAPVLARWAGVRPRSRTRAPMLGAHPFRAGEFIANGGFKIGFGMAPLAGEAMADLVLNGDKMRIPTAFDPALSL